MRTARAKGRPRGPAGARRPLRERARAALMTFALLLSTLLGALSPAVAWAFGYGLDMDFDPIPINYMAEDELEDPDYSWSIGFDEVVDYEGFQWYDDLRPFLAYSSAAEENPNSHQNIGKRDGGWRVEITEDTPKGTPIWLRFTGGRYNGQDIDAVVSIVDWTWKDLPAHLAGLNTGISVLKGYKSVSDDPEGKYFQTFNFYSMCLAEFVVDVQFVLTGSDTPVQIKGHLTTTDLDFGQSFSFSGSVVQANIAKGNEDLKINEEGNLVYTEKLFGLDDSDPEHWHKGMVEGYFDTTRDGGHYGEPLRFYFGTSYGAGQTAESIFFLSTDFLTAPPTNPDHPVDPPVKTADPASGVSVGDHVTFDVDVTMHEEARNCRWGWHYTTCQIVDVLPPQMRYVEGTGRLLDEEGNDVTHLGKVIYDGDDSEPNENTVRFEFDREALKDLDLLGQHYHFVFDAELTEYPDPDEMAPSTDPLKVHNNCYVEVNGDKNPGDEITVELLEPQFSVDKSADDYEWEVGDVVHFTVRYKQTVPTAQSRHTVVSDNLPEYLELIPDSVKATGVKDLPPVEVNANEWSINFDKFNYGDELVVEYDAVVRQSGNGKEIVNQASIHAANAPDEDDPEEIWANTANVEVEKGVDRYEGYVGASDQDPGFFEYTVTFRNAQAGTVANDVVVTDDSLPEGMRLGRNNDGSLMIMSVRQDGAEVTMSRDQDKYSGTLADIQYRVGEADGQDPFDGDFEHDQTVTVTPAWEISPKGTGWEMHLDHLAYGTDVTLVYRAYPEDSVSGWEIENKAEITADNSQPDDDTAVVWVNQPHFAIDKQASNDAFTVNDDVLYEVKVTNSTPGTLARNVVISDLAHTQGVELLHDTIKVYDSEGKDITDSCTISYKHNPYDGETFIVETNRDLIAGMTDEMRDLYEQLQATTTEADFNEVLAQIKQAIADGKGANHDEVTVAIPGRPVWRDGGIVWLDGSNPLDVDQKSPRPSSLSCETELVVCYRVKIEDAELAGQTVDNTALVVSDEPNTATTDDEVVDVKGPKLVIEKSSDKDAYQVGETGHYTLVATQTREDCVAKGVIVSDLMDERDVASIVHGSVHAVGPDGQAIQAEPQYVSDDSGKIVGFALETGVDLADEESVTVTYDVTFEKAGTTLHNVAQANATNTVGGTDDELVKVVDPYSVVTLEKSVDRDTVRVGEWATYTLSATVADHPAKDVVITDKSLPEGMPVDLRGVTLEVNGVDVDDFQLDVEGNGFAAHLGDLGPGDVARVTYRAQVRDEALLGTSVVNTATLTSSTLEEPLRDDASVTVPLDEPAVTLEKYANRERIHVGETVSYVVEATVPEDSDGAQAVVVSDASLPEGMPVDMASIRAWLNDREVTPVNAQIEGNAFSIPFGDLRPGETVRVSYDATAEAEELTGTDVTNVATLTSESIDEPLEATATVSVVDASQTILDKTASAASVKVGEVISYAVRAVCGTDLSGATLVDEGLPEGVQIDPATIRVSIDGNALDTTPSVEGTGFSLALGGLRSGNVIEVAYEAVAREGAEGTAATNVARLSSPDLPEPLEDEATVEIVGEPASPAGDEEPPEATDAPEAPATLEKRADKGVAQVGETVSYLVTATARADLAEARLSDSGLPEGVVIDEQSFEVRLNGEPCEGVIPTLEGTDLVLELDKLAVGDVVELAYEALVEDEALAGETLVNTALLEGEGLEEPLEATATVEVAGEVEAPGNDAPADDETDDAGPASGGGESFPNTGQSGAGTLLIVFGVGVAIAATVVRVRQGPRRCPRR